MKSPEFLRLPELGRKTAQIPKDLQKPLILRLIAVISIASLVYYLWWRATATLNPQALTFSWVLWLAEAFGVFNYLLFAWMTQDVSPPAKHKAPAPGLTVDILVPTYDESLDILEATLTGCKKIRYPHMTYVLDDGDRAEVKQLTHRLGCSYIARPTNEHAKAGNINYALRRTTGKFIVVLDADMVPQPDFLDRTLGYFENEKLAFIQLPQEFYNLDSIQHDPRTQYWHEQSLFFRVIQPGKNRSNSAFWCGSPSILRRAAVEDAGGIATETITEDIHTSVRLHSRGWDSMFLNEALAFGIAPQTIKAFLLQRLRWAQGTMQLYRSSESPLWIRGLSFRQRLSYLASFLAYFESFQKFVLLMTPIIIILFNAFPMKVDAVTFLWHWIPYYFISMLANLVGGRGYFKHYQTEKYNLLKMVVFIQASLMLFLKRPLRFQVTPKTVKSSVYREERRALRAYMAILGVITGTLAFGLIKLLSRDNSVLALGIEVYLIAYFWTAYNAILILVGIVEILRKNHERRQFRFDIEGDGILYDQKWATRLAAVEVNDISIGGVNFVTDRYLSDQTRMMLHFTTPQAGPIRLPFARIHHLEETASGSFRMGVSFNGIKPADRERLFSYLFVELPRKQNMEAPLTQTESLAPSPRLGPLPEQLTLSHLAITARPKVEPVSLQFAPEPQPVEAR